MDKITSYATLQSAVAGMIHRSDDTDITDNVPLFIQLAEADLNDDLLLKDMETETTLTATLNQNYVTLPSGFVSPIALWVTVDSERTKLTPVAPQELPYDTSANIPQEWAIDGVNIRFDCPAADTYSMPFRFIKSSNLSDTNTTNYLLLKRPDVYLYGALKQCALFQHDDTAMVKWGTLYNAAKQRLKAAESRSRGNVPLRTDLPGTGGRSNIFTG